jgi:hypothetical protein
LDREAARPDNDVHALWLVSVLIEVAVLIELVTQHGDGDRKRADDKR